MVVQAATPATPLATATAGRVRRKGRSCSSTTPRYWAGPIIPPNTRQPCFSDGLLGDGGGLAGAGQWSTVAVMFGKATYVLVAYAILALFLTVLTSSSSMGIAMSLAYYFAEFILRRILGDLFAWFDNVSDFLIGFNTAAWMSETGVVTTEGSLFPVSDPPGELHAFLVLLAYIVVLGTAAFWLFQRRDVAGARGE